MFNQMIFIIIIILVFPYVILLDWIVENNVEEINPSTFPELKGGDTILIKSGKRKVLRLKSLAGTPTNYIIVKNMDGRVEINAEKSWVGIWVRNCQYLKISGNGDPQSKYGFLVHNSTTQGVIFQEKSSFIGLSHVEIYDTHIGVTAKTTTDLNNQQVIRGDFVQYNTTIHNIFIHDVEGEAMYIGSSHWEQGVMPELMNVDLYNNLIINAGYDGIQIGSAVSGVNIHSNVILNSGWKDTKVGDANGKIGIIINKGTLPKVFNNIIIGSENSGIYLQGYPSKNGLEVFQNSIYSSGFGDNLETMDRNGITFFLGKGTIHNNLIVKNYKRGILYHNDGLDIFNNFISGFGIGTSSVAIDNKAGVYDNIESQNSDKEILISKELNSFRLLYPCPELL